MRRKSALPCPTEHQEQCSLVRWWELTHPRMTQLLFAIPNGGARNAVTGALLKREGVRKGVPDLFLAIPTGKAHGLFIEMKRQRGGTVDKAQKVMHEALQSAGYGVVVCKGFEEAMKEIKHYLGEI